MIIFCSGIAGCGEKEYLEKFEKVCRKKGKEVNIFYLGNKILEIGRKDYPHLNKYDLIEFPESTVNAWRAAAFESIKSNMDDSEINIIDSHTSYWIKNGPEPAINTHYLKELDPDMYIQIIDHEPAIKKRIEENEEIPKTEKLSLEEVIRWQEVERYTNRIL